MPEDKMREEFDAWVRRERPSLLTNVRTYNDDEQVILHVQDAAWAAWQARGALAVRKPLTDAQVEAGKDEFLMSGDPPQAYCAFEDGVRFSEREHNIGSGGNGA